MATEPSRLMGQNMGNHVEDEDSEMDAEHDEDVDMIQAAPVVSQELEGSDMDAEGEEVDAEGEEVDEEEEEATTAPVAAVEMPASDIVREDDGDADADADGDEDAAVEPSSEDPKSSESEADSGSDSESDAVNEWEGQSDTAEEAEAEIVDRNCCVFCGEDEEHDPSEEFEEYLACLVCGDNAHRQCARNANSLKTDDDAENWRCTSCVENGLQVDDQETPRPLSRRRSSAQKLTRDLLPPTRGANDPEAHSVFNTLIHPDDPMDGSRSLRKRKADSEEQALPVRSTRKRRLSSQPATASENEDDDFDEDGSSPNAIHVASKPVAVDTQAADSDDEGSQVVRSSRRTRPRRSISQKVGRPSATILTSNSRQLVVAFMNLDPTKLSEVLSSTMKQKKRRARDRARRAEKVSVAQAESEPSHYPAIQTNFTGFFGFPDREMDESKQKPYGGILSETEADTSKTFPQTVDRKRFETARLKAEDDWRNKIAAANVTQENSRTPKVSGPPSKIKCINFGGYEIDTWHAAPYPEEYSRNKVLYICEFCLKYMNSDYVAWRHKLKCPARHPPGDEIYRDDKYSFFEVDGRSKTLYYDVEPFLFYVMTETDSYGCHFVGYFSKEKRPSSLNNVSCILVLPIHQRKGFGHMLIEFSYLLTRVEKKTGSPEKPLSDMGLVSYRSYWRLILCYHLLDRKKPISIANISEETGMTADDIVSALEGLRALVRDPTTKTYALRLDYDFLKHYIGKFEAKNYPQIKPERLVWTPYVMGRSNLSHYDEGPPLQTIAQREGEDDDEQAAPEEGVQMTEAEANPQPNGHGPEQTAEGVAAKEASGSTVDSHSPQRPETPNVPAETVKSAPSTPQPNGVSQTMMTPRPASGIPPTRFEVFPPIPGVTTTAKKRGRPFMSSGRRNVTPVRRGGKLLGMGPETPLSGNGQPAQPPTTARRTRSKLGEVVVNGFDGAVEEEDDKEESDLIEVGKAKSKSSKSAKSDTEDETLDKKGKGKAVEEDEDGDGDVDAIGEDDPDV